MLRQAIILALLCASVRTTATASEKPKDFFEMSLEELMEVRLVTGASRLPYESGTPSSPVTIITAADIRASGLTSIPEILRFACGADVLQIERRRYAVGVHGLHETFSDRTTLLIDGRLADNPVYGGPDFQGLPLLVEDIARIEVVRSPGSASWGANALTGVVNIVTKEPADMPGGMAKATVTEFGDSYTHVRWAEVHPDYSWRVSAGYEDVKSSEETVDGGADYESGMPMMNPLMGFGTFEARDFSRNLRVDSEALFNISEAATLSIGLGHTHIEAGDYELGGYYPRENDREDHIRSHARLERHSEDGDSAYVQWAGRYWDASWPMAAPLTTQQHELETQYNFTHHKHHYTSVGASVRWDHLGARPNDPEQVRLGGAPRDEYNTGVFAIDRWEVSNRWTLEGQIRGDYYTGTEADWSGRLTTLTNLDPDKDHVVRLSAAKAFRAPLAQLRRISSSRMPLGGGLYVANLVPPASLDNEQVFSYESGYTAILTKWLSVQVDVFYQEYEDLIGYRQTVTPLGQFIVTPDNVDGASAWGGDLELIVDTVLGRVAGWYSYNEFDPDRGDRSLLTFFPPRHKAGVRFRHRVARGCVFNLNYAYADTTPGSPIVGSNDEDAFHRLDLTISKTFNRERGEIMLGVSDLFNKTLDAVRESATYTGHELPGRTFFMSLRLTF